jgi:formate dehydrogenase subunit delta
VNPANLIKMANQIGAFFEAMPEREQAVQDVAAHILRNWEPRMRRELLAHVASAGDGELKDVVRAALPLISAAQ